MFILNQFKKSAKEFANPYSLTVIAMLLALRVVLGYFANFTLAFLPTVKFGLSFLPFALSAIMFGPVAGAFVGGMGDIFSFILNPTGGGYFPGFTISGIITGIFYGIILYKNNCTIKRLVPAWIINTILIHILLGSFWLYAGFGLPFLVSLGSRTIQSLALAVPEILLIFSFSKVVKRIPAPRRKYQN